MVLTDVHQDLRLHVYNIMGCASHDTTRLVDGILLCTIRGISQRVDAQTGALVDASQHQNQLLLRIIQTSRKRGMTLYFGI